MDACIIAFSLVRKYSTYSLSEREYMLSIWASESRPLLMFELQSWVYKEKGLLFHLN